MNTLRQRRFARPAELGVGWLVIWGVTALAWWFAQPLWFLVLLIFWGVWKSLHQQNTELAQLEKELQVLQKTQQSKDELLAMVSHELRTPMNVVMGLHPRIREGLAHDASALSLLDQMYGAAESLLQVFKSILDASQKEAGVGLDDQTSEANGGEPAELVDAFHPWRIMVVDDNLLNVLVVRLMLAKLFPNAQLWVAHTAHEAMQQLAKQVPHVVLLDVLMPEVDGYALARWVRQHNNPSLARVPLVALTGSMSSDDAVQREASGMDDVIYKPVDEQQLRKRIGPWLQASRSEEELT